MSEDAIEAAKKMNVFKDEPEIINVTPDNPNPFTEFINQPPKVYPEPDKEASKIIRETAEKAEAKAAPLRVQEPGQYEPEEAGIVLLELNLLLVDLERQLMALQGSIASAQAFHQSVMTRIQAVKKMQHP